MEPPEGRDNQRGRDVPGEGATILRFPRDWFGPPEELVPFGPRAERATATEVAEPERGLGDEDAALVLTPASADTFWSADSARIHDAVETAEAFAVPETPIGAPRWASRRPRIGTIPARRPAVVAGCLLLLGMALIGLLQGGASPAHHPVARAAAQAHNRPWVAVSHPPALRGLRPSHRTPQHHRVTQARGSVAASSGSSPSAAHQTYASSSGVGADSGQQSASSQSSDPSASAASAQSSSQPAFGAGGALGPGSSPNS